MGMIKATKVDGTLVWVEPATATAIEGGGTLVVTRAGTRVEVQEAPEHFSKPRLVLEPRIREVLERSAGPVSMSVLLKCAGGARTAEVTAVLKAMGAKLTQTPTAGRPASFWSLT